jgi:hypothetical protein
MGISKVQHYTYTGPDFQTRIRYLEEDVQVTILCLAGDAVKTLYIKDGAQIVSWSRVDNILFLATPDWISKTTDCP